MNPAIPGFDDATLVAWLDGELSPAAAESIRVAVTQHRELGLRVQLLRAARAEFVWATLEPESAPPTTIAARQVRKGSLLPAVFAAAALAIVVWFGANSGNDADRDVVAENAWLSLRLRPVQPAWDLFSAIRFELEATAKTNTPVRIVARKPGETDAQLATRVFADDPTGVPVVLDAELTHPDGRVQTGPVERVAATFTATTSRATVELVDVKLPHPGISPLVKAKIEAAGVSEDYWWGIQRVGLCAVQSVVGCLPEEVGEYRLKLTLRSFTPLGDSRFLTFSEPLSVATGFAVRGVVSPWSEAVDGMKARILCNTDRPTAQKPLVVALQLRNESDRPRSYNVTGVTQAAVPQPFHFDLVLDGERCVQRDDLGVVTAAMTSDLAHPVSTNRSIVFLADYWQRAEAPLSRLRGRHRLAVRFHFQMFLWDPADNELWQGEIPTPAIDLDFGSDVPK